MEEIEEEGGRPAYWAALARGRDIRRALRRAERGNCGRCPYCGKLPEVGRTACAGCREAQRRRNEERSARRRAARLAAARAAGPRQCEGCGSGNLKKAGKRGERQRYRCRDCGRRSMGDGIPPPPTPYPCPYCKGQCRRRQIHGSKTIYSCKVCGRRNTNLWPDDRQSPGGPFPHVKTFYLNYAAHIGLMAYCQAKKMSEAQAVRDIFIAATVKPRGYIHRVHSARPIMHRYERYGSYGSYGQGDDAWNDGEDVVTTVAIPPPVPTTIPAGGVKFPNLVPEMSRKYASQKGEARYCPTVLVIRRVSVCLNDAALAGLIATMQARGLNHQEAARALLAEAKA